MKHIVFILLALISMGAMQAQTYTKTSNNTYKVESSRGSSYEPTNMQVEYKGKTYQVYKHTFSKGKRAGQTGYFIRRVSTKTGKEYWYELKNFATNM